MNTYERSKLFAVSGLRNINLSRFSRQAEKEDKTTDAADGGKKKKGGTQIPEEWPWQEAKKLFEKPDVLPASEVEVNPHRPQSCVPRAHDVTLQLEWKDPDVEGLVKFLVVEKGFKFVALSHHVVHFVIHFFNAVKNAYEKGQRNSKSFSTQNSKGVSTASSPSSPKNLKKIKANRGRGRGRMRKGRKSKVERSGRQKTRARNRPAKRARRKNSRACLQVTLHLNVLFIYCIPIASVHLVNLRHHSSSPFKLVFGGFLRRL